MMRSPVLIYMQSVACQLQGSAGQEDHWRDILLYYCISSKRLLCVADYESITITPGKIFMLL